MRDNAAHGGTPDQALFELAGDQDLQGGTVMSVGDALRVAPSATAYDRRVVGVATGPPQPGPLSSPSSPERRWVPIATSGLVRVRVSLLGGPISVGDLLVSSSRPGEAMRARNLYRAIGAVVGKAVEPFVFKRGQPEGMIRMLVRL